jgi:RNA polymerase sigma-70 factor (ECF subfamily)
MTAVLQIDGASALTLAWVRTALVTMAAQICGAKESRRVARADEAMLADVRAAAGGDGDAYSRIIRRFQDTIARRIVRFTRDPRMIEELTHDVFVEAYFGLAGYRGDAPFEHWLQRIATRVGYRYWTRRSREAATSVDVHLYDPQAASCEAARESADEVAVVLEKLAPRDRLVLTLLYLESRSVAEAADLAGWSETMVKVQAHRARKRFRKLLEESNRAVAQGEVDG